MSIPTSKDVGQTVRFKTGNENHQGVLRYLGRVEGQQGDWCGIELREAKGKNDGSVKGKAYFQCPPKHGLFVKKEVVSVVVTTRSPAKRLSTVPSSHTAPKAAAPISKRASIAPTTRPSAARQSISSVPARKTSVSRPTSQTISRESVQPKNPKRTSQLSEISVNNTPEEGSIDTHERDGEPEEEGDNEEEEAHADTLLATEHSATKAVSRPTGKDPNSDAILASELSRENGALKVKLQTMEKKRMEDREVIKRVETLSSENERFNNIIKTLQAKVRTMTDERRDAQAKVQALEQKLQAEPERPGEFESELELATLNKEMAEERAEGLQLELDNLRVKYDELSLESEILREEHNELASTMTDEERANAGWLHLERERDRLREALLLLRDNKQEVEAQLREEIDHLQDNLNEAEETAAKFLDTAESLARAEDINTNLKEQLEAAENQEEVISNMLSERDRHLSQIEALRSNLSELEELAETNQDLEAFYVESERAMLVRLDQQEERVQHRDQAVRSQQEKVEALEFTINKYHKVVQDLQGDIEEARRTKEISELRANEMNTKSRAMLDLNISLQKDATRSQAQVINIEVAKAEARLKSQHVEILSLFLPESFDTERTPITALLSFSRLRTKAAIVANILFDRLRDRGHLESGENALACYEIVQYMRWIQETAGRFERFMSTCSAAEYVAFSNVAPEIEPVERAVTDWLERLKSDELGNDGPDHMQRMQSILSDMAENLIPSSPEIEATHLLVEARMVESHTDIAASLLDWLKTYVKSRMAHPEEAEEDTEATHFSNKVSQLATQARTLRLVSGRTIGELERNRSKKICLDETSWPLFSDTAQHASTLIERVQDFCQIVIDYFNDISLDDERSYPSLTDSLSNGENDIFSGLRSSMDNLHVEIDNLTKKSADLTSSLSFEPRPAPWLVRAKEVKTQRHVSSEIAEELQQLQHRNTELTNRIVEKERIIEETTIKAEHFEKRVKDNKSKEGSEKALKDEIAKLNSQKRELDLQLSTLNIDLRDMQDQNKRDKDEIKSLQSKISNNAPHRAPQATTANGVPLPKEVTNVQITSLLSRIATLESSIRHLKWENKELAIPVSEVKYRVAHDAWLNPANLKRKPQSQSQSRKVSGVEDKQRKYHEALIRLVHDPVMSRQIKLAETWREGDAWRSEKESGKWLIARQKERLEALRAVRDR